MGIIAGSKKATLAGQRAQFTWALNQYNLAEDEDTKAKFAKRMAELIAAAPANGFTVEEVTKGQLYPAAEVTQYTIVGISDVDPGISEVEAENAIAESVDTSDVIRVGKGLRSSTPTGIVAPRIA